MAPSIARLEGAVRRYAWGSRTVLAHLQGRGTPSEEPEAELWFGAHPVAPADLCGVDGGRHALDEVIATDPAGMLGAAVAERFDGHLPFLLKVLAVELPLSLQVHPTERRAREGFAAEEARGLPRDAPERVYRDTSAKPELLYALTPVDALCGFRGADDAVALLDHLGVPALRGTVAELRRDGAAAMPELVRRLLTWPSADRAALVGAITDAARGLAADGGDHATTAGWIAELGTRYPTDPGVAVALLLDLVQLEPGAAVHVPPGELHAYLRGTGIELMATSDNVLRGGLTPKHVDVDGLLEVLESAPAGSSRIVEPRQDGPETVYATPTPHFRLSRVDVRGEVPLARRGPEILLVVDGHLAATADDQVLRLGRGEAAFVAASTGALTLSGTAQVFRATVGETGTADGSGQAGGAGSDGLAAGGVASRG